MRMHNILMLNEGISHIEDLPIQDFIASLRAFEEYEISEKIDGANLQFGLDENGFYTSREDKGGSRLYNESEYPKDFQMTFRRSAHLALEKVMPLMVKAGLSIGDRVEVEVLYGELPNAIRYTGDENRIVFLRTVEGNVSVDELKRSLDGKKASVTLDVPYTTNGKDIKTQTENNVWSFVQTPIVDLELFSKSDAKKQLDAALDNLEKYLHSASGVGDFSVAEVISLPLNKKPNGVGSEWKELKLQIKDKKQEIERQLYDVDNNTGLKYEIKHLLLNELVRKVKSAFGPEIKDGGWIEGVVFRHKGTSKMFKVVDKDIFLTIKDFLWDVRSKLATNPLSANNVESFLGDITVSLASSLGHPELGTVGAKRYIKKQGSTPEEVLQALSSNVDFGEVKTYWVNFIARKQKDLAKILEEYKKDVSNMQKEVDFGKQGKRQFRYDEEINKRTLQVFASLHQKLQTMQTSVASAKSVEDLVLLLVGKQISEVF